MPYQPPYFVKPERKAYTLEAGPTGCLMLHGFLGSPASSYSMAEYLAKQGITVHCPLLPGHGELPNKLYRKPRDEWLQEAEEAYDTIRDRCDELVLMGHSMGTVLGAELFVRHEEVSGMILLAPAFTVPDWRIQLLRFAKYLMPWFNPLRSRRLKSLVHERLLDFDPSINLDDPAVKAKLPEMTRVPTGAIDEMRKTLDMGRKLWSQLDTPIIIFQGNEDVAVDPAKTKQLFDLLPSPDKQLIYLKESGHELMRPFDPGHNKVWATAAEFIASHTRL